MPIYFFTRQIAELHVTVLGTHQVIISSTIAGGKTSLEMIDKLHPILNWAYD